MAYTLDAAIKCVSLLDTMIGENRDYLGSLDSSPGDGDHGLNMSKALNRLARRAQTRTYADLGAFFRDIALNMMDAAGGYAGSLYGVFLMKIAQLSVGKSELSMHELADVMRAGLESMMRLGRTKPGDKTIVDTLSPTVEALSSHADDGDLAALTAAAAAAKKGMESTEPMPARRGLASADGDMMIGRIDAGAMSAYLMVCAMRDSIWVGE